MRQNRMVDPVQDAELHAQRRHGVRSQKEIVTEIERGRRVSREGSIYLSRIYCWYRANIGASGDAAYLMRVAAPSSDSAWAMLNLPVKMPRAFRVVGGDLWSSGARSGGTATLRVRIVENGSATDYDMPGCVLNATDTQTASDLFWDAAPRGAAGATIEARCVTAGTWGPTTADVAAMVAVVFEVD